jgi:hypothetical protein
VVVEFDGTITVVFAGGGGLLLLMQPDSIAAATTKLARIFIFASNVVFKPSSILGASLQSGHEPMPHAGMSRWSSRVSSAVLHNVFSDMGI